MTFQTYKEWKALGRQVVKGQKAYLWDETPVFSEEQTKSINKDYSQYEGSEGCDSDWEADNPFMEFGETQDIGFGY